MYDNSARFLIRLPDAPDTKGTLAGRRPGPGGIDTLRANYWGRTEADVNLFIHNLKDLNYLERDFARMETFFIEQADKTYLSYVFGAEGTTDTLNQGPFERNGTYTTANSTDEVIAKWQYVPVALRNVSPDQENDADANTIPEKFLMSYKVYDMYDKGTDIKVADYSNRRMSPIEDFAVGIPPVIITHDDTLHPNNATYVRRYTRDPKVVEMRDPETGNLKYPMVAALQQEWKPDPRLADNGAYGYYHPIGYPLFLEAEINYDGEANIANKDLRTLNETVFFVINETTGDFIRTNLKQVSEDNGLTHNKFRSRVEMLPDMTKRNPQTTVRRSAEKLLNLGVGDMLLYSLRSNPVNEDRSTLKGRKYYGPHTQMGGKYSNPSEPGIYDLYINRDHWAPSNNNTATYWAGEKYQALPVDTGDVVRIISRTALWKYGVVRAFNEGLAFKISSATMPPVFTGDIIRLGQDTITKIQRDDVNANRLDTIKVTDFLNKIWVTEDRNYPVSRGIYSSNSLGQAKGRDSILAITAIDYNGFYDPRSLFDSTSAYYAQLSYSLELPPNTGISKWLRYNIIPSGTNLRPNLKDGARGFMVLKGTPMNPYVIPGGEEVTVTARNFAPSKQTIDLLRNIWGQDTLDKFIYIFPPYFHAPEYDLGENVRRARYLQQDTINNASDAFSTARAKFRLFVADSTPRFISYNDNPRVFYKDVNYTPEKDVAPIYQDSNDVRVMLLPSIYRNGFCTLTEDNKLIASVTDKLRFQVDFNTDDEAEDFWASKEGWEFKYGKTSYGFYNIAVRENPNDTAIIEIRNQTRPIWMNDQYIYKYNNEDAASQDNFLADYTSQGRLNVRIDSAEAFQLLRIGQGANMGMNLDTLFTVVANDGHSGMTAMPVDVYVNVKPFIQDIGQLPEAQEDVDYNPNLLDTNKMIKVYDPNTDQFHRFELIYPNDLRTRIPKDPCFSEAGYWDLTDMKTTPSWLKINPQSGLLYGMPTINDNIREGVDEKVTVLVWDRIRQSGTKANIKAIKNNGTSLFAVGDKGTIIKVDKTGGSWEFVKVSGTEAFNLNDITFVGNGQIGYIAGDNGLILKTTDGGTTWNIVNTTYRIYNLNSIEFKDDNNGIAAGQNGNAVLTNDGGTTWSEIKKINTEYVNTSEIAKVKYLGLDKYLLAGTYNYAEIITSDGMNVQAVNPPLSGNIRDIYQISANDFILITANAVYTSNDAGTTWTKQNVTHPGANSFTSIGYYEINDDAGFNGTKSSVIYITGNNGTLYVSRDGGKTFLTANANTLNALYRVRFNNRDENITKNINDLVMIDENNGFIVGNEGMIAKIVRTQNIVEYTDNMGNIVQDTTVNINPTVITTKEFDMLSDLKQFNMKVKRADHSPVLTGLVKSGCFDYTVSGALKDTLFVMDLDLLRPVADEFVVLTVIDPVSDKWEIIKDTIKPEDAWELDLNGNRVAKKRIPFILRFNGSLNELGLDNIFTVKVQAKDSKGNTTVYEIVYRHMLTPDFISKITVANNNGDSQILEWGTAPYTDAEPVTTGDGNDDHAIGMLDYNYCEYEIAPTPDKKIFDSRWIIPTRTGTLLNIQPRAVSGEACQRVYKNTFQTGGNVDAVGTGNYVPLKISWDRSLIPAIDNATINPAGSSWWLVDATSNGNYFAINMSTGLGKVIGDAQLDVQGNTVILTLMTVAVEGFNIIFDCTSGIEGELPTATGIINVAPSIVSTDATVNFGLTEYGRVKLEVYDALGNFVKNIADRDYVASNKLSAHFDGRDAAGNLLPNGTYTIRMIAGTNVSTYQVKVIR